ncbi:hypothetical protein QBC42DRAFT_236080 [Cladorrhinum samala]|uniref:Uncharacterized protein n=1 Tax=Cladorrhinum samala TaxID=585594 RepID=A0AAV9HEP3_9PEZI|nr:hypothetical protein QBC42DRAFT_236080 [Cladorrhinum samala]
MSLNAYNPQCTLDQCLNQVVGNVDLNPAAQVSACVSLFGTPATVTLTNIPDVVFSTSTVTVPYTDIIISTSTAYSTVLEEATSYTEVPQTVTEFTATRVSTEIVEATPPAVTFLRKRHAKVKKRGGCKPRSKPSTTSTEEPSTTSTEEPSTTSTEEPSTTSSASNCIDLEQYSSACSCIGAASDATQIVTLTDAAPTSLITETVASTGPASISTSVITVIVTETQTQLATATATTTLQTIKDSVETATSTVPATIAPTVTAIIRTNPLNRLVTVAGQYVQYDYGNTGVGAKFQVVASSGRVSLIDMPSYTLWLRTPTVNYGVLWVQPAESAGATDRAVTCVPDSQGNLSCATADGVYNNIFSCGAYMYLGKPTWVQGGCTKVIFTLTTA